MLCNLIAILLHRHYNFFYYYAAKLQIIFYISKYFSKQRLLFQTPAEAAKQAVENDVHVLGVSSLAAGHKTLVPQVIEELKKLGRPDIMVIASGVIPAQDYDFLYKAGVAAIFGPGSPVAKSACTIMELLMAE